MKKLFSFLFVVTACLGHAEIRTAPSLKPIEEEVQNSSNGTLVLLDIGGTLLAYPDAILHPAHGTWKYNWLQNHYPTLTKEEKIHLHHIVENSLENWELLNHEWPQVIQQAQNNNAKVVAFSRVCKLTKDPFSVGARAAQLLAHGICFKDDLPELSSGNAYKYAQGVIETDARVKGPVLKEILSQLTSLPEKIIFVDDRIEQIQSVDTACNEMGIACIAFHYLDLNIPELDEKIADYQLSTLVKDRHWISESKARNLDLESYSSVIGTEKNISPDSR